MERLSESELAKIRQLKGYHEDSSLCPYCGVLLVSVPYVFNKEEKEYLCMKCNDKIKGEK
jgi:hypothetical protein